MMRHTIYKYPFNVEDHVHLDLPEGADILTVQVQQGQPCIWALVDLDRALEPRTLRIWGTGHPIDHDHPTSYLGSIQLQGEDLVFHVFEEVQN